MKKNILFITITLLLFGCNDNNDESKQFNENKMLADIVNQIIKPEEERFYKDALVLQTSINEFVANTTAENLDKAKKQWFTVAKDWARCYAFNIGDVKKGRFFRYFGTFPVNEDGLESKIAKVELKDLTKEYVLNRLGLNTKGIYGLEYLLYKDDTSKTVQVFSESEKRRKILQLIANEFVNDVTNCKKAWDEYAPKLLANKESKDNKDNSFNLIFGGIDNVIHYAWETKIGKAIRKKDIEAPYSGKSFDLLKENIVITKKVYFDGGIDEKVKFTMKGYEGVNKAIKARYDKIDAAFNAIQTPLKDAVKNADKDKVIQLLKEVEALEKVEFSKVETVLNLIDGTKEGDGD